MTVIARAAVTDPQLFAACAVKMVVPPVVGVPLMTPLAEFNDSPAGRAPLLIDHVIGAVPLARRVVE